MSRGHRAGKFTREQVIKPLQQFCPDHAELQLIDVNLDELLAEGKKLILVDIDNTMVPWRTDEFPPEVIAWIAHGKELGLKFCIISNTRNPVRLARLSEVLGVDRMQGRFKPSKTMYLAALKKFSVTADEAIMIGDQLFTDVFGANRSGIDSIWIKPMTGHDFIGTKFSRFMERLIRPSLHRGLATEEDDFTLLPKTGIFRSPVLRQFAKFCVVGGTSFFIDYCISMTIMFAIPWGDSTMSAVLGQRLIDAAPSWFAWAHGPRAAFFPIAGFVGASVAILNSFLLNRRWTFKIKTKEERAEQFRKFIVISVVGLLLNVFLRSAFNSMLHGDDKSTARIATILAALIVAFWNFFGQRLYAFRARTP